MTSEPRTPRPENRRRALGLDCPYILANSAQALEHQRRWRDMQLSYPATYALHKPLFSAIRRATDAYNAALRAAKTTRQAKRKYDEVPENHPDIREMRHRTYRDALANRDRADAAVLAAIEEAEHIDALTRAAMHDPINNL